MEHERFGSSDRTARTVIRRGFSTRRLAANVSFNPQRMIMSEHDDRIERIRTHLRGVACQEYPRGNFYAFVMGSQRGAVLAREFYERNLTQFKLLLEWHVKSEPFGALILNRPRCVHCQDRWDTHVPPGGKCLFSSTEYHHD